jgi:hypothetical protein
MCRGTVQVKKSAADGLRVCSEKPPNIAFETDAAKSAAPLNFAVGRLRAASSDTIERDKSGPFYPRTYV